MTAGQRKHMVDKLYRTVSLPKRKIRQLVEEAERRVQEEE